MDFQNLDEYYEYLENDTNFQYLDLNTYKTTGTDPYSKIDIELVSAMVCGRKFLLKTPFLCTKLLPITRG